jgi:prepilin-type N-terminal cleavage/methylation domain-containing protein
MKNQKGFTLIEVLVYLGIFTILMMGILTAAFGVFESSNRDQTKIMIQVEGDFLIAKINRALSDARSVEVTYTGATDQKLSIQKWDYSAVAISLSGTDLNFSDTGHPLSVLLNNSNVRISNLTFATGTAPEYIRAKFTVSALTPNGMTVSEDFSTTKYLRN